MNLKIIFLKNGVLEWNGSKSNIFKTDNQAVTDFVYSSNLYKKVKNEISSDIDLLKIIKEIDSSIIQDVTTFDVYEGENIPKDKKSVAINVTLQSINKTLSEKDLDQISKKIIEVVKEKTGATIRS